MYEYDQFYNIKSTFIFETKIWKHIFLYYFMGSFMKTHSTFKKKKKTLLNKQSCKGKTSFHFLGKKVFGKMPWFLTKKKKVWREKEEYFLGWKGF